MNFGTFAYTQSTMRRTQIGQIEFSSSCSNNFLFINISELIKKINRRLADLVPNNRLFGLIGLGIVWRWFANSLGMVINHWLTTIGVIFK